MSYIKIKASNKIAKIMSEALPDYDFKLIKLDERSYKLKVDYNIFNAMDYGDYDYKNNCYKAIRVRYPDEYYAMDNYISSKEIIDIYKSNEVKNKDDLKIAFREALMI